MPDEPRPTEPQSQSLPPLVDWMSRHGWKILVALVAIELLFHAYAVGAQERAAQGDARPVAVRVNVALSVPRVAFVSKIVPVTVVALPDGRREVSFNIVVSANCRWRLQVRPRFPRRRGSMPRIEVRSAEGVWTRLDDERQGVVVVRAGAPCTAEGIPVALRMESGDAVTALGRVQFDVSPLPE